MTHHWVDKSQGKSEIDIKKEELSLFSSNSQIGASVYQSLPMIKHGTVLFLSAEIKCDNVLPGREPWNLARVLLVQNNGQENRWDLLHAVAMLTGTHDWKTYQNYFYITHETKTTRVIAELNQSTGSLYVRNLKLYPVNETQTYLWIKDVILFSWGAFFVLLAGSCLLVEKKSAILRIFLASAFISIVIGTSLPGYIKDSVWYKIETQIDVSNPGFRDVVPWDLTKVWHASIFFLLGLVLCLIMKRVPFFQVVAVTLMMAASTEMIQLYIDGRTPLISDFLIDAAGGFAGITSIKLFNISTIKDRD